MSSKDVVRIPDFYSAYASFQYRLWFTWRLLHEVLDSYDYLDSLWSETMSACPWLWENESDDEECIKEFAEDLSLLPEMSPRDWDKSYGALRAHQSRTRSPSSHPLTSLISQTRLRFIAWLMVPVPHRRKASLDIFSKKILKWAKSLAIPERNTPQSCSFCGISHILPLWIETMRQVYELDHLRSIPWNHECDCWESSLTALGEPFKMTSVCLHADSPVLLVLYELVVPLWPLICWVAFRTIMETERVDAFLDILHTPDRDLLEWDDEDNSHLLISLRKMGQPWLYPHKWIQYMLEIDLQTWLHIRRTTWTEDRLSPSTAETRVAELARKYNLALNGLENICVSPQSIIIRLKYKSDLQTWLLVRRMTRIPRPSMAETRLIAFTRKYTSTLSDFRNIHVSLGNVLSKSQSDHLIPAITNDGKQSTPADWESKEFWVLPELETWLARRRGITFQTIWKYECLDEGPTHGHPSYVGSVV
ncbi:hypothetical protein B0H16DRAFT_1711572 [Mycena metata]|uniref:Uncharacterized protein n=1 Tax=Mycena metata TaxID=1033252 RepID=A0AAD7K6L6_9AGAR|nr:hypothetical protein B0H16DRAFT_1711572 [Mycena metata]